MRRLGLVPLLAVVVFAVAGCAVAVAGSPAATTDPSASVAEPTSAEPTSEGLSAAIDPCTLLTGMEIQQLGLLPSGRDTAGGGRACSWHKTGQYSLGVEVFDHAGLDQLSTIGRTITNHPVGSHDGRLVLSQGGGGCGVYLQLTATSIVLVDAAGLLTDTQSCQLADQYAMLVERKLPAEQR
jgi:hypothetical protein